MPTVSSESGVVVNTSSLQERARGGAEDGLWVASMAATPWKSTECLSCVAAVALPKRPLPGNGRPCNTRRANAGRPRLPAGGGGATGGLGACGPGAICGAAQVAALAGALAAPSLSSASDRTTRDIQVGGLGRRSAMSPTNQSGTISRKALRESKRQRAPGLECTRGPASAGPGMCSTTKASRRPCAKRRPSASGALPRSARFTGNSAPLSPPPRGSDSFAAARNTPPPWPPPRRSNSSRGPPGRSPQNRLKA
mmetsp:Transcript_28050/g.63376  ORF Transcript_28050/g.63376 Transcript_28050/m.63376 type:complete len:253 (+) Transcript_28050:659-1417(+)